MYVKQRYEQTKCEGEVDTSKTNVFTYVKIGNLIENLGSTKTYTFIHMLIRMIVSLLMAHFLLQPRNNFFS